MSTRDTSPSDSILPWLAEAALAGRPVEEVLAGFARRLNARGLGIGRAYLGIRLLHPLINARGYIYRRAEDAVRGEDYAHAQMPDDYQESPIQYMLSRKVHRLYRALHGAAAMLDFPLLELFAAQGYSAWMAHLIPFTLAEPALASPAGAPEGAAKQNEPFGFIFTLCCDRPEGWSKADQELIESLLPSLSAAIQGRIFATFAQDLLTTYLGGDAAQQVLQGTITRGKLRRLRAAILYADLRGFTTRAEAMEPVELVGALDRHFEALVEPIMAQGGEVLKFIGDGLLAAFPAGGDHGEEDATACRAALTAAQQAMTNIASLAQSDTTAMPVDIALHLGDVLYGNVGGRARLDFTIIGPAVNMAARMEQKCQELDSALILSGEVAARLTQLTQGLPPIVLRSLGCHHLRGIAGERELFTLASPQHPERATS
ncbi:MAG: adenylate/guanylate cyclase domain-containing protein [Rhodospirillaceae bacterium]|nr:MAG: adenylate/guanylate cyclase domain-containing protein [Rhodospirillaceae bacterium]